MNTIIIPSKYIYDIKNEKVKNNVIKNVSFDLHNARYENENNNYTEISKNLLSAYLSGGKPTFKEESDLTDARTLTYTTTDGGYYRKAQLIKVPFSIKPKISFNGVSISSVDNIILNNLKFSISWSDVIHAKTNGTWEEEINVVDKTYKWLSTGNNFTSPKFNGTGVSVKYEALLVNNGNNDTENSTLANWGFPYIGRVLFMVMSASNSSIDGYVYVPYQVESKVNKNGELLRVSTIENFVISLSGNISTLVISNTNEVIGNSNEVDISIGGNELLQTQNKYASRDYVNELYQEITTNWENGKETATINCSISDYFTNKDIMAISKTDPTLPMTFNIGDIVCPMVLRNNGEKWIDKPMSLRNGVQKTFVVEGIEIYYDGATMQRIYLIEND